MQPEMIKDIRHVCRSAPMLLPPRGGPCTADCETSSHLIQTCFFCSIFCFIFPKGIFRHGDPLLFPEGQHWERT